VNAIVTVRKGGANEETVSYRANGKQEARSVNGAPTVAWSILGHIPLLIRGEPENALVIGLGSGITLGAMQSHPLKSFDVVELEPAVVEASRFFKEANNDALGDKG
jgi:spermidine synthase